MKTQSKKAPKFIAFDAKAQLAFVKSFRDKRKTLKKKLKRQKVSPISDSKRERMSNLRTIARQIEEEERSFGINSEE